MENKINVAELLKDCPKGMELDCALFNNSVTLNKVADDDEFPITIETAKGDFVTLTKYGTYAETEEAKCVIFPKGKTTWEGFAPPCQFKDGDIITCTNSACSFVAIFKEMNTDTTFRRYVSLTLDDVKQFRAKESWSDFRNPRLATEEEKAKLFQTIKDNGYKWNEETKTLEKLIEPKFKVGDRIKSKELNLGISTITKVCENYYELDDGCTVKLDCQDEWELVPNKFDISTLKPFDKVLVRDNSVQEWGISFFSHCNGLEIYKYSCINGSGYAQCVPYEENKHLLRTTNDCDDFYKNWI